MFSAGPETHPKKMLCYWTGCVNRHSKRHRVPKNDSEIYNRYIMFVMSILIWLQTTKHQARLRALIPTINVSGFDDVNEKILSAKPAYIGIDGPYNEGIPDYRSEGVGLYARTNHRPIQYIDFIKSAVVRQRYWARNFVGWFRFSQRQPNAVHHCIRDLEVDDKIVYCVVTQNVDNLHFKAGSRNVIELHGSGYRVVCLNCDAVYDRFYIQEKLMENNHVNFDDTSKMIRPDGDVEIPLDIIESFKPPICESCNGILKPDIIFFGDNVPKNRVDLVKEKVHDSDSVLVLGSSLSVFSGYRIILQAIEENKNICIVNIGPTRADKLGILKIEAKCGDILPKIRR